MTLPNFLIIGAQKSGTTALYYYLKQHPQIYMSPEKEPHFFTYEGGEPLFDGPGRGWVTPVTSMEEYRRLFQEVSDETAVGEASPSYIYFEKAAKRIKHYIPETRLIAILRNPADRAYSNFLHAVRSGREPRGEFDQALREEDARIQNNWGPVWHYRRKGFYYEQLKRYFDTFHRDQIKVCRYEDLEHDPTGFSQEIFDFLGVDDMFTPEYMERQNVSGVPRNRALRTAFTKMSTVTPVIKDYVPRGLRRYIGNKMLANPPQFSPETRQQLIEVYRDDILKVQELVRQDLSHWLE
ncbi:hypothetical protein BH23PAT1_BH23PAT1_0110 [soil metagenome]